MIYNQGMDRSKLSEDPQKEQYYVSPYAQQIKKCKKLIENISQEIVDEQAYIKNNPEDISVNENGVSFLDTLLKDKENIEKEFSEFDLSREYETEEEYWNKQKEKEKLLEGTETINDILFRELQDEMPEKIDKYNKLSDLLEAGFRLSKNDNEFFNYFIYDKNDILIHLLNGVDDFFINGKKLQRSNIVGRKDYSLLAIKLQFSRYEKDFPVLYYKETQKHIIPVGIEEFEHRHGFIPEALKQNDTKYETEFENEDDDIFDLNSNFREIAFIRDGDFVTVFTFAKQIHINKMIEKHNNDSGFELVYNQNINISNVHGNISNTINFPEDLFFSILHETEETVYNPIVEERKLVFVVSNNRDKRIRTNKSFDLFLEVEKAWQDLKQVNEEQKFPVLFRENALNFIELVVENGRLKSVPMTAKKLRLYMAKTCIYHADAYAGNKSEQPPLSVMETMLQDFQGNTLPVLNLKTEIPYFTPHGRLIKTEGFDPETKIFFFNSANINFENIEKIPSEYDVNKAVNILKEPFRDFPFKDQSSFTNFMSLILAPFLKTIIPGALFPLYIVLAPKSGTGKSLLIKIGASIYSHDEVVFSTAAKDDSEWTRKLYAMLKNDHPFAVIDNVKNIDSEALASIITSGRFQDRELGTSTSPTLINDKIFCLTGNNPQLTDELDRRSIYIHLDAEMENPAFGRKFKIDDLNKYVKKNRVNLIWACMTIISYWFACSKPKDPDFQPMASFETFTTTVAGILRNAGFNGFYKNAKKNSSDVDPESEGWRFLIKKWSEKFGEKSIFAEDVFNLAKDIDGIEIHGNKTQDKNRSFGKMLLRHKGQVFCGFKITDANGKTYKNKRLWSLKKC